MVILVFLTGCLGEQPDVSIDEVGGGPGTDTLPPEHFPESPAPTTSAPRTHTSPETTQAPTILPPTTTLSPTPSTITSTSKVSPAEEIIKISELASKKGPLLWMIDGEQPSYLFGTIHLADERVLDLPEEVSLAFNQSDALYTEIPLDLKTTLAVLTLSLFDEGQSLEDFLPSALYQRTDEYMRARGTNIAQFSNFKIWFLAILLQTLDSIEDKSSASPVLDRYLYELAIAQGIETGGLETAEEQASIFDSLTIDEQIDYLEQTLDLLEEFDRFEVKIHDPILKTYLLGDDEVLMKLLNFDSDPLSEKMASAILRDRNYIMADRIAEKIRSEPGKTFFFAVGAGHLPGEEGIVQLLTEKGYKIHRVTNPSEIPIDTYKVTIDGYGNDWNEIEPIIFDKYIQVNNDPADIKSVRAFVREDNLYLMIETVKEVGHRDNFWFYLQFDTNNDLNEDYQIGISKNWIVLGRWAGAGNNVVWTGFDYIKIGLDIEGVGWDEVVEAQIPLFLIDNPRVFNLRVSSGNDLSETTHNPFTDWVKIISPEAII